MLEDDDEVVYALVKKIFYNWNTIRNVHIQPYVSDHLLLHIYVYIHSSMTS